MAPWFPRWPTSSRTYLINRVPRARRGGRVALAVCLLMIRYGLAVVGQRSRRLLSQSSSSRWVSSSSGRVTVAMVSRRLPRSTSSSRSVRMVDGSDALSKTRRAEFVGSLKGKPGLRRYLRRTPSGLLRIDRAAAKREAHLDGKWLLRISDMTLTPDDLAAAYKQLVAVERGWRDCKGSLGLRPVHHHREDRIRAHVQLLLAGAAAHPRRRDHHRRHLAQRAPRARPHAPGRPGHRRRPRRATLSHHRRAEDRPHRPRTARTTQVLRVHRRQ